MSIDIKDVAVRALKTFSQAFTASILTNNGAISKQVIFSALVGAVSVVWNTVLVPTWSKFKTKA